MCSYQLTRYVDSYPTVWTPPRTLFLEYPFLRGFWGVCYSPKNVVLRAPLSKRVLGGCYSISSLRSYVIALLRKTCVNQAMLYLDQCLRHRSICKGCCTISHVVQPASSTLRCISLTAVPSVMLNQLHCIQLDVDV